MILCSSDFDFALPSCFTVNFRELQLGLVSQILVGFENICIKILERSTDWVFVVLMSFRKRGSKKKEIEQSRG